MKYFLLIIALTTSLIAEEITLEFIFTTTAEMTSEPRLAERITRMEVTFDTDTAVGKLKSYSPFSDSFEVSEVKAMMVNNGLQFYESKESGMAILSFSPTTKEANYSNNSIMYGTLSSYLLFGTGKVLENRSQ